MEPHAVPKDILNADFKLFGAFSLSQFLKMVMGCLVALFFYFMPIPVLIKIPLVVGPILIGVGIALVPRFAVRFENYTKAIFISPRYIWVKETVTPDTLRGSSKLKTTAGKVKKNSSDSRKDRIEEISLESMLSSRDNTVSFQSANIPIPKDKFDLQPREQNLDRVYDGMFENVKSKLGTHLSSNTNIQQPQQSASVNTENSIEQTKNKINYLKRQLSQLVKDENYKEKETEILHQINDLYHELKMKGINDILPSGKIAANEINDTQIQNFQGAPIVDHGQIVYGIVVDKNDHPVPNAEVFFDLRNSDNDVLVRTDERGRFNSNIKIAPGDYNIEVKHPKFKFNKYTIQVHDQKLPAYKLRAR